jgi:hypothetical protein
MPIIAGDLESDPVTSGFVASYLPNRKQGVFVWM